VQNGNKLSDPLVVVRLRLIAPSMDDQHQWGISVFFREDGLRRNMVPVGAITRAEYFAAQVAGWQVSSFPELLLGDDFPHGLSRQS
jgi:hypothetical protein